MLLDGLILLYICALQVCYDDDDDDHQRSDSLRARGHDFVLLECSRNLHKQSFIVRCLFDFT